MSKSFLVLLLIILLYSQAFSQTMFRMDAVHSGHFQCEEINNPLIKWKFKTDGVVRSTPLISDGVVYIGSYDKNLYALNADTGEEKWKFETGGVISSSPAILSDELYFYSKDGYLYSVDKNDGTEKWKFQIESEIVKKDQWDIYTSSPTIYNNVIYIGSDANILYAISIENKDTIWTYKTNGRIIAAPAVDEDAVYVGSMDGFFYALDRKTGDKLWDFDAESNKWSPLGEIQSSAVIADSLVAFGTRGEYLYVLRTKDGSEKWKYRQPNSWFVSSPSYSNGVIYIGDSDGYHFHAFDILTGEKIWDYNSKENIFSSPIITNNNVYFATGYAYNNSFKGSVYSMNIETGEKNWSVQLGKNIWSSTALADGKLCVGCEDGYIYMIGEDETTSVNIEENIPKKFNLYQNYPNPFNPETTISYYLQDASKIKLEILNATGSNIKTLVSEYQQPGKYTVKLNCEEMSSGVYLYRLILKNNTESKKMLLLK